MEQDNKKFLITSSQETAHNLIQNGYELIQTTKTQFVFINNTDIHFSSLNLEKSKIAFTNNLFI